MPAKNMLVQLLAMYTNPESHNAQRHRQTDRRTDGQQDDANSRSYCVAVRSAKNWASTSFGYCSGTASLPVWPHCVNVRWIRCQADLNSFPLGELEETTGTPRRPCTTWMKTTQQFPRNKSVTSWRGQKSVVSVVSCRFPNSITVTCYQQVDNFPI